MTENMIRANELRGLIYPSFRHAGGLLPANARM